MSALDHTPPKSNPHSLEKARTSAEVAPSSKLDILVWFVSIGLLIASTLVSEYLPRYWELGSSIYIRIGVTVAFVLVALLGIYSTRQGKALVKLVKESRVELRRITWPTKQETLKTTWIVAGFVAVMALFLWLLDMLFGYLIKLIVG